MVDSLHSTINEGALNIGRDKVAHTLLWFLITILVGAVLSFFSEGSILALTAFVSFSLGVSKEIYDGVSKTGNMEFLDIVANTIGIILGLPITLLF